MQMGQLEPIVNKVDSSVPMGFLGPVSSDPMSQQQVASNDHVGLARGIPGNPASQGLSMSIMQSGSVQSHASNLGTHQLSMSSRQTMQMETTMNSGPQQMSTTPKRKAPMELLSSSSVMPNKKVTQAEHRPWLQQISPSNKGAQQSAAAGMQQLPALSKRKTQTMEPASGRLGGARSLNSKGQNAPVQQSSKVQTESSESVRSKMRESLAAALALVSRQDKPQVANNSSPNEVIHAQGKLESSSQCASSAAAPSDAAQGNRQETTHSVDVSSATAVSDDGVVKENRLTSTSNEDFPSKKFKDGEGALTKMSNDQNISNSILDSCSNRQDFQLSYTLTTDDVPFSDNFFVKDELLQGNGLSWVLESDIEMQTQKEGQINEELRSEPEEGGGGGNEQSVQSPELLASRIEAELFKLFGGVNKKYKEKGRSLLFNLKDRNNPDLRERVLCGEISPDRLCSMTAEGLASKELSQWRIAKAEELAQMVVLPNSDVDVRRLVKKTHKGEYQVEVEHDDKISVEVSGGVSSASQSRAKRKDAEAPSSKPGIKGDAITSSEKNNFEKDNQCALTIPSNDGADPMQDLMADDALKDADFLPPIVSLDEFMESLHSEPPFENLTAESEKASTNLDSDGSKVGPDFKSSDLIPSYQVEGNTDKSDKGHGTCSHVDAGLEKRVVKEEAGSVPSETKCGEIHADSKSTDELADVKPTDGHTEVRPTGDMKSASDHTEIKANRCYANDREGGSHLYGKAAVSPVLSKGERIWEGTLQLSISATHPVMGIFKSGEKTSVKDWPGSLEIKGRVRLDAFEKFLQELPMSRTRAVMVVHFVSKEESPRSEQSALREVADSYIVDERVGFAEPVPRVELYFCPPHRKTVEMLSKIIPKEHIEEVNAIDFGLIGLIVWRKTHVTSTISPTSSSHHKHSSKKQYLSSRKQQQDTSLNSSLAPTPGPVMGFTTTQTGPSSDDDDDDIPPGFGPAASRDEDDLPEFNFSGGPNPSVSRLVQKPTGPGMAPFHTGIQTTSRPVENLRELVHKYGQGQAISSPKNWQDKSGVAIQPWNDDDDDIPEWQPHAPQNQFPQQHNFQPRGHMANQSYAISQQQRMLPMQSLQPPMNVTQRNNGMQPSNVNYGLPTTQGIAWRQNDPRSRGF